MHSKRVQWLTWLAALSFLLCLAGLGWAVNDYLIVKPAGGGAVPVQDAGLESAKPNEAATFGIVAIGDSLTRGMGDNAGKGYVGYTQDLLGEAGRQVSVVNLGIKGLTTTGLLEQLQQREIQRQIGGADAILMTIGANDLFMGGSTLANLAEDSLNELSAPALDRLNGILHTVHGLNADAAIYVFGLYDPFAELELGELTSEGVRKWNYEVQETAAAYPTAVFVPVYDLFQGHLANYLFTDRFHPNEKGYKQMAERVTALMLAAGGQP
jgi:lysophospholipase L1-like esterase